MYQNGRDVYDILCSTRFRLADELKLKNLGFLDKEAREIYGSASSSGIAATFTSHIDPSITWAFISKLRGVTKLPIWVKARPHTL